MQRILLVICAAPLLAAYWTQRVPQKYVSLHNPFEGQSDAVSAVEKAVCMALRSLSRPGRGRHGPPSRPALTYAPPRYFRSTILVVAQR